MLTSSIPSELSAPTFQIGALLPFTFGTSATCGSYGSNVNVDMSPHAGIALPQLLLSVALSWLALLRALWTLPPLVAAAPVLFAGGIGEGST
jgi:hypothetical protein